jgi:hypothetical protein
MNISLVIVGVIMSAVVGLLLWFTVLPDLITAVDLARYASGITTQAASIIGLNILLLSIAGFAVLGYTLFNRLKSR